jgi:hypothetical protein
MLPFISLLIAGSLMSCESSVKSIKEDEKEGTKMDNIDIEDWQNQFDFDGDRIIDSIYYQSTGGANCCYELSVRLSKFQKLLKIPFLVDGGYLFFDLSQKENFNIIDQNNDGTFEIFINIDHIERDFATDELNSLQDKYGFKTSKIRVDLSEGEIKVFDYK